MQDEWLCCTVEFVKTQDRADTSVLELFCDVDDFCQVCRPLFAIHEKVALPSEAGSSAEKQVRNRATGLAESEIMTILIYFHQSNYRDFKHYYNMEILCRRRNEFPKAPTYSRFVTLTPRVSLLLALYLVSLFGKCTGFSFVDSTKIEVCGIKREYSHKVFKDLAKKGKTSTGWFFGFKLHIICNDHGDILWFTLTAGNVDDRAALETMLQSPFLKVFGKMFGDKAYISAKLFEKFIREREVALITGLRKNMKTDKPIPNEDAKMLRKRAIIESINDQLKNISQIQHTRHRSSANFLVNLICGLIAYCRQEKRPSLHRESDLPDLAA